MLSSDWVALAVALPLGISAVARTSAALHGRNRLLWVAHILIVVCLLLAITPVYSFVDGLLGQANWANLLSHLLFGLVLYFGCQHVALGISRPDLTALIVGKISWFLLIIVSTLMVITFVLADIPSSSMGLNAYRGEAMVIAYKSLSFLYPMLCSLVLLGPLFREATGSLLPLGQRVAFWFLGIGFSLVVPVPFIHLAEFWFPSVRGWVDVFLYAAILLVSLGPMIAFLQSRRQLPHNKTLAK